MAARDRNRQPDQQAPAHAPQTSAHRHQTTPQKESTPFAGSLSKTTCWPKSRISIAEHELSGAQGYSEFDKEITMFHMGPMELLVIGVILLAPLVAGIVALIILLARRKPPRDEP